MNRPSSPNNSSQTGHGGGPPGIVAMRPPLPHNGVHQPSHYAGNQPPATTPDGGTTPPPSDMNAPPDMTTPPSNGFPAHTRCGWIDDPVAEQSFVTNAAQFNAVHPKWFTLASDGVSATPVGNTDLPSIVQAAAANNVRILPLIDAADTTVLRNMLGSPTLRAQHVANLVKLVHDHGYAGLDIDYEHLWSASDRPGYTAFMQALSTAFHAQGYELSMALEPLGATDSGNNGYDYNALAQACDTLHMMCYDFHWVGGDHMGPVAPLGWVDASFTLAESTGHKEKFMIGLANYAIGANYWCSASAAAAQCTSAPATSTTHMLTCPYGTYDAGRTLSCPTANGTLWFEDVASMEEKINVAIKHGARGVTYWTLGDELPGYFDMVKKYFP